jgi:hypothetical protein
MDAAFADARAQPASHIGTPASPSVAPARPRWSTLGSGILEPRFLAFLPELARTRCSARNCCCQHRHLVVRAGRGAPSRHRQCERMMIGPALSTRLPFEGKGDRAWRGARCGEETALIARLTEAGSPILSARKR